MLTKKFALATLERALSTFAQAILAVLLVGQDPALEDIDWLGTISVGIVAFIISVLKSIVAYSAGAGGPSIGGVEELTPPPTQQKVKESDNGS